MCSSQLSYPAKYMYGTNRARTYDPLLVRQMLSQLSYDPISYKSLIATRFVIIILFVSKCQELFYHFNYFLLFLAPVVLEGLLIFSQGHFPTCFLDFPPPVVLASLLIPSQGHFSTHLQGFPAPVVLGDLLIPSQGHFHLLKRIDKRSVRSNDSH